MSIDDLNERVTVLETLADERHEAFKQMRSLLIAVIFLGIGQLGGIGALIYQAGQVSRTVQEHDKILDVIIPEHHILFEKYRRTP